MNYVRETNSSVAVRSPNTDKHWPHEMYSQEGYSSAADCTTR